MPRDNWPQLAHKGIPPGCSLYCLLLYCTLYNSVHVLTVTLRSSLYIVPIQVGKCAYYSSIILTKIESLLCLKIMLA